jgi:hypothetical protein
MRRLIAAALSVVAVLAFGSASASAHHRPRPTTSTSHAAATAGLELLPAEAEHLACLGNGGYVSGGTWKFKQTFVEVPVLIQLPLVGFSLQNGCKILSADNYNSLPPIPSTEGQPLLGMLELPAAGGTLQCLKNNGVFGIITVFCLTGEAQNLGLRTLCVTSPAGCSLVLGGTFDLLIFASASVAHVQLSGHGDFKCGNGTLSGEGFDSNSRDPSFTLKWTATFHNGLGTVTGTAISDGSAQDDPGDYEGAEDKLSGVMLIADGSNGSTCNDTSPNQTIAMDLSITE